MTDKSVASLDLPQRFFPITVQYFRTDNDEELVDERVTIEAAPFVLEVPSFRDKHGVEVWVRITYATGNVVEEGRNA